MKQMKRQIVIHQPDFLPYLGFFHRLINADIYIVLDHVQFSPRNWTHRDKIKTQNGPAWLSVSIQKSRSNTAIKDIVLAQDGLWRTANINAIKGNYGGSPYFDQIFPKLVMLYSRPITHLVDFNLAGIDLICELLGISIDTRLSSEHLITSRKSEMNAELVAAVGGARYLSGIGARAYHDQTPFNRLGIEVVWQEFTHPIYPQQFGEFVPYLSTIDALFNCGPEETVRLLRSA